MQLSQISLQYLQDADRLLLRVKSVRGELIDVWLTRRLVLGFWPHANQAIDRLGAQAQAARLAPGATVLPEAQAMLAQSAKTAALQGADFSTPFDAQSTAQPLGAEPLLPVEVQLAADARQLRWTLIDAQRRQVQLQLNQTLAMAVRELFSKALAQAHWGIDVPPAEAGATPAQPSRVLN
jgi:hypothetical protein